MLKLLAAATLILAAIGPAAAEPAAKWCGGLKIAAFAGGPEGSPFSAQVASGFRQAELDLGPTLTLYYSDWDANKMLTQMRDAVAAKVDGIAAYGMAGDRATSPLIDKLFASHGVFTSIHTQLPQTEAKYARSGMGFVGAQSRQLGLSLATEAAARAKLAKGDEVLVFGLKAGGGERALRTAGVLEGLAKSGAKVTYQEIDTATNKDANAGTAVFAGLFKKNPKFKLVITDHGGLTANAGVLAKAADLKPGQVAFAGVDFSPETAAAIGEGYLTVTIDQEPFVMGYLSVLDICLAKKFGFIGMDVSTAGAVIDKNNVEAMKPLAAQHVR